MSGRSGSVTFCPPVWPPSRGPAVPEQDHRDASSVAVSGTAVELLVGQERMTCLKRAGLCCFAFRCALLCRIGLNRNGSE